MKSVQINEGGVTDSVHFFLRRRKSELSWEKLNLDEFSEIHFFLGKFSFSADIYPILAFQLLGGSLAKRK